MRAELSGSFSRRRAITARIKLDARIANRSQTQLQRGFQRWHSRHFLRRNLHARVRRGNVFDDVTNAKNAKAEAAHERLASLNHCKRFARDRRSVRDARAEAGLR